VAGSAWAAAEKLAAAAVASARSIAGSASSASPALSVAVCQLVTSFRTTVAQSSAN
jgi:hypothetical protein